jgi:hypothetical protein
MNEADYNAVEVFPDHSLYASLSAVERAKMYKMGFINAGQRVYELAEHLDFTISAGSYALPELAVNGKDFDLTFQLAQSTYFASVKLLFIADQLNKAENISRAVRLHTTSVIQLKKADLICSGFVSHPALSAKQEWGGYHDNLTLNKTHSLPPELFAETENCSFSYKTARELFSYDYELREYAVNADCCDDYHDSQCWYCSYDT